MVEARPEHDDDCGGTEWRADWCDDDDNITAMTVVVMMPPTTVIGSANSGAVGSVEVSN